MPDVLEKQDQLSEVEPNKEEDTSSINEETPSPDEVNKDDVERPEGWDTVDFENDSRDKIEKRFHRIFGQLKRGQTELSETKAIASQLAQDNRAIIDRLTNWEEAQRRTTANTHAQQYQAAIQKAIDDGDSAKVAQLTRGLAQLEARTAAPVLQPNVQQSSPPSTPQSVPVETNSPFTTEEIQAIDTWSRDKTYAQNGSKFQRNTLTELMDVFSHPEWEYMDTEEKLEEVDRRMKNKSRPAAPPNMSTNSDSRRPAGGPKLTEHQQAVARMMWPDKPTKEAYSKYAKGLGK